MNDPLLAEGLQRLAAYPVLHAQRYSNRVRLQITSDDSNPFNLQRYYTGDLPDVIKALRYFDNSFSVFWPSAKSTP